MEISKQARRADLVLVERGFFESRAKAQEAIEAGLVRIDGKVLSKASAPIAAHMQIEAEAPYPWVSRGGLKLAAALEAFSFDPHGRVCLDIGASTGGFTDVLLSRGAARVYAVDVGHDQLHQKLLAQPRVISMEGMDARMLTQATFSEPPHFITCDVSFISLRLVLPSVLALAAPDAMLVALIKPQFEVGPALVIKGLVKNETARARACADVQTLLENAGWSTAGIVESPIAGGDGNREYLVGAMRSDPTHSGAKHAPR